MQVDAQELIVGSFLSLRMGQRQDPDKTDEVVWNGGEEKMTSWFYLTQKEEVIGILSGLEP